MEYDATLFTTIASASASFVAIIGGLVASKLISINGERSAVMGRISELDEIIELKLANAEEIKKELEEDDALEYIRDHIDELQAESELKDVFENEKPQRLDYGVLVVYWKRAFELYQSFTKNLEKGNELNDDGIPIEVAITIKNCDFDYNVCQLFADYEDGTAWVVKHGRIATESNVEWYNEKSKVLNDILRELGVLQLQREQLEKQKIALIRPEKMGLGLGVFVIISIIGILVPLIFTLESPNFSIEVYKIMKKLSLICMIICLGLTFGYLFNLLEWKPKQRGEISMKYNKKKTNTEFKDYATYVKRVAAVLFIISIYFSVRWSDSPLLLKGKLMALLFEHSGTVDSAMLNLVTGYFTGYIVYIFTVVIPTWQRQKVVRKYACRKLISLYNDSIFLLLLMAKSASTENEWKKIISNEKDLDCFGEEFYEVIGKFDIQAPAETLLKLKDNVNKPIPWYDYLEYRYERIYNELDDIFLKYHMYLDEELLKAITEWKLGVYFDMFLGKGNNSELFYTGDDGIEYKENISVTLYCQQKAIRVAPIFGKNEYVDNADRIREHVENLGIIYKYCKKSVQGKLVDEDYTLNTFKKHNIGHIGTSRM